jgi:hypothetical protein
VVWRLPNLGKADGREAFLWNVLETKMNLPEDLPIETGEDATPANVHAPLIAYGPVLDHGVNALSLVGKDCNRENEKFFSKQEMVENAVMEMALRLDHVLNPNVLWIVNGIDSVHGLNVALPVVKASKEEPEE